MSLQVYFILLENRVGAVESICSLNVDFMSAVVYGWSSVHNDIGYTEKSYLLILGYNIPLYAENLILVNVAAPVMLK